VSRIAHCFGGAATPRRTRGLALLLAVGLVAVPGCSPVRAAGPPTVAGPASLGPGPRSGELYVGSHLRTWTAYVPPGIALTSGPVPLVVVLHGSGGEGRRTLERDGWIPEADRGGFIVVAPDGLPARPREAADPVDNPRLWNDGHLEGTPERETIDDVAFLAAMLDRLGTDLPVDTGRTFLAGYSNGGGMAFRAAAGASGRFRALAVVASYPWTTEKPTRPMPTLYVVGTADPFVPLAGGRVVTRFARQQRPPVATALAGWARAIGIADATPRLLRDDANVRLERYGEEGGVTLDACFVKGQGHGWPGSAFSALPSTGAGPTAPTVDATRLVWESFVAAGAR
jgi:polyhydroxybutyrate depolymerase